MSTSTQASPVLNSQQPDPPNSDAQSSGVDLPPDPLLDSGSFIDASTTNNQTLNGTDTFGDQQAPGTPAANGGDSVPVPESTPPRRNAEMATVEPPNWLPPGWKVLDKKRTSGATAGTVDKYYIHIESGSKFRSRKEVFYFLETGTKRKKQKSGENSDANRAGNSPGSNSHKRQRTKEKKPVPHFDFDATPEKITWVLVDEAENKWTAFIDGKEVPENVRRDWAAVFSALTGGDFGDEPELKF